MQLQQFASVLKVTSVRAAIPAEEMDEIRKRYDEAIKRHGKTFGAQYGWAAKDLNGKQPTFKEIEEAVKIDHLRGHYRMASHGVHANPKGIFFSMTSMFPSEMLLAGASNAGLADAGDGAALSGDGVHDIAFLVSNVRSPSCHPHDGFAERRDRDGISAFPSKALP